MKEFWLEIHNGTKWKKYELSEFINKPICIECCYPKKGIVFELKEDGKTIDGSQLKNYEYGNEYRMKKISRCLREEGEKRRKAKI